MDDQAIKVSKMADQISIPVAGVSTAGVVVTTTPLWGPEGGSLAQINIDLNQYAPDKIKFKAHGGVTP